MSDKIEDKTATKLTEASESEMRRRRLRALIIGSLASSGAFQLNGWQVQAHGNRSSHTMAALRSSVIRPEDYVLFRQQMTAPNSRETLMLSLLANQQNPAARVLENPLLKGLHDSKEELERRLRTTGTTTRVLDLIHAGDVTGAAATIEEQGVPQNVLDTYLWTLLDIAYLGNKSGTFTDTTLGDFIVLAEQAVPYCKKALDAISADTQSPMERAIKERVAEIFHNIAAFTIPDTGTPNAAGLALGLQAALDALKLREELGQRQETMIANWMVGWQYRAANKLDEASRYLQTSLQQAEALNDVPAIAWAKAALAKIVREQAAQLPAEAPARAQYLERASSLEFDIKQLISGAQGNDIMMQLLAMNQQLK